MPFAPSPIHHHFYGWDSNHQKWVVYDIAIPILSPQLANSFASPKAQNWWRRQCSWNPNFQPFDHSGGGIFCTKPRQEKKPWPKP